MFLSSCTCGLLITKVWGGGGGGGFRKGPSPSQDRNPCGVFDDVIVILLLASVPGALVDILAAYVYCSFEMNSSDGEKISWRERFGT